MVHWPPFYFLLTRKKAANGPFNKTQQTYFAVVANYINDHPLGCNLILILVLASLILRTTPIPVNLAAI